MSEREPYSGGVCYADGDHYSLAEDNNTPETRLYLEPETGEYFVALDDDPAYHERFHQKWVDIEMEDGAPGMRATPEEFAAIQEFLRQRREDQ